MNTMNEGIYDATLVHQPEEDDVKIDGEIQCPSCGGTVFTSLTGDVVDAAVEEPVIAPFDCSKCDTDLKFIIEPLPTEETGLGITVI